MSNLNNLTSKIVEDAKEKAKSIIEEANNESQSIIDKKTKQAESIKKDVLEKAKSDASLRKDRIISSAELEVRNKKLKAKQEVINKVFNKALDELSNMEEEIYMKLVKDYILSMDIAGDEELMVPEKYKNCIDQNYISNINSELKASGKKGEIKLSSEGRSISSGFILSKNGIDINNTFETLVGYLRDELEAEIVKILFN